MNPPPEESQLGLHLPDEGRYFPIAVQVTSKSGACPLCGSWVQLHRENAFRYLVVCASKWCNYKTATHRTSQEAVKEFRVTAVLHQR